MIARSYKLFCAYCSDYLLKAPTSTEPIPTAQQRWQNATNPSSKMGGEESMDYLTNSEWRGSSSLNLPHHTQGGRDYICNSIIFLRSSPSSSVAVAFPPWRFQSQWDRADWTVVSTTRGRCSIRLHLPKPSFPELISILIIFSRKKRLPYFCKNTSEESLFMYINFRISTAMENLIIYQKQLGN